MSNITLFKSGATALPDYLRDSDDLTKLLAGGGNGGKQISIKGGVWRLLVAGEEVAKNEDRAMNFIVVGAGANTNRTFYMGKYEEGKTVDPTCWSENGKTPDAEVPAGQRQASTCEKCPQNIAGSGEGESRACRYSRRLAVALENDLEGNVYRLQLPAKSIFGKPEGDKLPLLAYAKFLQGHGVPMAGVVTEARFDTSAAVPVLRFRAVRPLTREEWAAAKEAAQSEDAQRAIEFKIMPRTPRADSAGSDEDEAPVAPKAALFGGAPIAATETDEEPIPEPTKRASKKPAAAEVPAGKKDAKAILDAWSTDDDE